MPYKTIEVDVDLDEFDTNELIDELSSRSFSTKQIKLIEKLIEAEEGTSENTTLLEDMKDEIYFENRDNKTLEQIEQFFKNK